MFVPKACSKRHLSPDRDKKLFFRYFFPITVCVAVFAIFRALT